MTARRQAHRHRGIASLALALACVSCFATRVRAAEPRYAFAVVSGVMTTSADEPAAQRLIEAIGLDRHLAFVVYDGNLKGPAERCAEPLSSSER